MRKSHKEELFRVAFRLFILDSFDGVSIPDIEKASGFTRGAIFYYADTKVDLFRQVMEYYVVDKQSIDNKVLSNDSQNHIKIDETSLYDFINVYVDAVKETMKTLLKVAGEDIPSAKASRAYLKICIQIVELLPDLHKRQLTLMEREQKVWETVLENAVERGEIKQGFDISIMARTFIDLFYGRSFMSALKDVVEPEMLRKEMLEIYNLLHQPTPFL